MARTSFVGRIAFEIDGDGAPVLLIHGLGGTSNTWHGVAPALRRMRTIALDLPGAGRSHRVDGPLSISRFVDAARAVIEAAGAERVHVIGHSLGTIVAMHLAVAQPSLVRSLALFGPLLEPPEPARPAIRDRARKAREEGVAGMQAIADALVQASTSSDTRSHRRVAAAFVRESLMRQDPEGYARSCEALADARGIDPAAIECPVLLVTGDEDAVAPPQSVRLMTDRVRDGTCHVLRGCGHWTPVERVDECGELLVRFYERRI